MDHKLDQFVVLELIVDVKIVRVVLVVEVVVVVSLRKEME